MPEVTYKITGMNNVDDPAYVGAPVPKIKALIYTEAARVVNADPMQNGKWRRRNGRTRVAAGTFHSEWADDLLDLHLYRSGTDLIRRFADGATTATLRSDLTAGLPMCYLAVGPLALYTDGQVLGRIYNGVNVPFTAPTGDFKELLPAGQCLALYKRRVYVGAGSSLFASDADTVEQMDRRLCEFPLDGTVQLIAPVDDGLFVATDQSVWYLAGNGPEEFTRSGAVRQVATFGGIPGTEVSTTANKFALDGLSGTVALFTGKEGICLAGNGGTFVNLSDGRAAIREAARGAAVLLERDGETIYLVSLAGADVENNRYVPATITVDDQTVT